MKRNWILTLVNSIAIVLIAASLFVLLAVVLTPSGQVPQVMGYSMLRVLTGSMEPEIPEQSMLLVRQTDPETLEVGDIISFFSPDPTLNGSLNTHRIARIESDGSSLRFVTKGDANVLEDQQTVDARQVVGKVVFVSPLLGKLVSLVSNPLVFGLVILLPLAAMLIGNLVGAVKSAAKLAKEEEEAAVRQALEDIKARQEQNADKK